MTDRTQRLVVMTGMVGCAIALACTSSDTKSATGPATTGGTPTNIVKVSGDSQTGPYLEPLPKPLIVKVTDSVGKPVTNASVAWATQLDGDSLLLNITVTNASGETQFAPTMNGLPGAFSVNAGINGHSVVFTGGSSITLVTSRTGISSGLFASCGITKQGVAFCWGNGSGAQLGSPSVGGAHAGPVPVVGGLTFAQVSVTDFTSCGLTTSGKLYCWGDQTNGWFGNGAAPGGPLVWTPVLAASGRQFSLVGIGDAGGCGLSSGVTYCWGANSSGAVGNGNTTDQYAPVPVQMPAGVTFVWVGLGYGFGCGLTGAGAAYCWGTNSTGQLGTGSSSPAFSDVPVPVTGSHTFSSLALSGGEACGLATGGTIYCWGEGANGDGNTGAQYTPTAIEQSGLTFTEVSAAGQHACAVTAVGAAYCWGQNYDGLLGSGSASSSGATPVAVTGGLTFATVIAASSFTCGYTTANAMYCWGANSSQQLGLSIADDTMPADTMYLAPTAVPGMGGMP